MKEKILIIPDVHGRTFWKTAIDKYPISEFPDLKIIFLGDYLDPYTGYENITPEYAYTNFENILYYAKNDPRITLLIGNHDWHYFVNLDHCRIDRARERDIENMFKENMDLFSLVKIIELNNVKYLFTHAGITQKWLNDICALALQEVNEWNTDDEFPIKEEDPKYIWISNVAKLNQTYDFENVLNECLKNYDDTFYSCLPSMISRERGGWYPHGSLIWADAYEHLYTEKQLENFYQIFGHTMSFPNNDPTQYYIGKNWAMIDASQAFIIDEENNLYNI